MQTFAYFVYYIFFCILIYILMRVIKKKYIGHMILLIMAISIFNNGMIWIGVTSKKVDEKIDKWGKRIDNIEQKFGTVGEKIDKTNDTVEKIEKATDKVTNNKTVKDVGKGMDKLSEIQKKIKDYEFKVREKIVGKKIDNYIGKDDNAGK